MTRDALIERAKSVAAPLMSSTHRSAARSPRHHLARPQAGGGSMTEAEFHLVTFEEIEACLQLREFEYRRPTRAKRLITKCPDCGADLIRDNPSWRRLAQLRQRVPAGQHPRRPQDHWRADSAEVARRPRSQARQPGPHHVPLRRPSSRAELFTFKASAAFTTRAGTGKRTAATSGSRSTCCETERKALADSLTDPDLRKAVAALRDVERDRRGAAPGRCATASYVRIPKN